MNELKTMLKRIGFYYLLLAIHVFPFVSVISDSFPTRNTTTIYLLILSVCLVLYYHHRVTPVGKLSAMMKSLAWMALLLIFLRGVKYSAFSGVGVLARHTWYLYYVPMLLFPLFLFYISLLISTKERSHFSKGWYWTLAVTAVLIVLVLTNDLHQWVFRFRPDFENWDNDYSRCTLLYVVYFWQYALYFAAISILVVKCRITDAKKNAWVILIPFVSGVAMNVLLLTSTMPILNGSYMIEFPEALIFPPVIALECCMQLGLIPTNTEYGKLFRNFSIRAQITDQNGTPVYSSRSAAPLTPEQFAMSDGARIDAHTVLHKMKIPGGYGFWQDDLSQLDHLNEELAQAREALQQEAELIRLRGELKEKQTVIEQRTLVYDTIASRTQRQSQLISRLAAQARRSSDAAFRESCRNRIVLLGAYIKRYANLTLLSQESNTIAIGELVLSVSEVLRYLNLCGIPSEIINSADGAVPAPAALCICETFESLLETNYACLRGVFVNLSGQDQVMFKLTFENLSRSLSRDEEERLLNVGVTSEMQCEDDVTYICFTLPRGGAAV